MDYDFFLAYASPDRELVKELKWQLEDREREVFMDQDGIASGQSWPRELKSALESSRVIVVLVSNHTSSPHYENEEIACAVEMARPPDSKTRLVPVPLVDVRLDDLPYGLATFQSIDGTRARGMERVAQQLDAMLPPPESAGLVPTYQLMGSALKLDRVLQWDGLRQADENRGNLIFLLHGPVEQNVELFLRRVQLYFTSESQLPRSVYRVPFEVEGVSARVGADWMRHMRHALREGGANAPAVLKAAPCFLILGHQPLFELEEDEADGLREFLTEDMPQFMISNDIREGLSVGVHLRKGGGTEKA